MRVVVLHGNVAPDAPPDEQDSLLEAAHVAESLGRLGYRPSTLAFSLDTRAVIEALHDVNPHLVFNLVESLDGEGCLIHLAPAVLDYLGLPYTGAGTEALFLSSNKLVAKSLLARSGIATPPWMTEEAIRLQAPPFSGPYIVKSVWEHASIGLDEDSVVFEGSKLAQSFESRKAARAGQLFAESYINGREINVALLSGSNGPEVLPPAEILFEDYPSHKLKVVGYRAKWEEDSFEYQHTPRTFEFSRGDRSLLRHLVDISIECWNVFGLRGYGRVDFRVDRSGKPWVLEVNANPCLSPEGGFAAAAAHAGLGFERVVQRIVEASFPPASLSLSPAVPGRKRAAASRSLSSAAQRGKRIGGYHDAPPPSSPDLVLEEP
ncbi:MAG: D-alanine--D-alanine ligase [bacterium]